MALFAAITVFMVIGLTGARPGLEHESHDLNRDAAGINAEEPLVLRQTSSANVNRAGGDSRGAETKQTVKNKPEELASISASTARALLQLQRETALAVQQISRQLSAFVMSTVRLIG